MALRSVVDSTEGMAADVAALYTKDDASGKFKLQVEGMVEKSKIDEFRTNNIELANKLKQFEGFDVEEAKKTADLARQVREKELIAKGDVDTLVAERVKGLRTDLETQIQTKDKELGIAKAQLSTLLIDSQVRQFAMKHGVLATAADDVLLRAKAMFSINEKGQVVATKGDDIVYGKDGVNPLTIEDWVKDLGKDAPHLFAQSQGSGAGGNRQGGTQNNNRSTMSSSEKIKNGMTNR